LTTTTYGASGLALLMVGSGTRPQYIAIGTGSGTATPYRSGLIFEVDRKLCSAISGASSQEVEFTADWGSVELNGIRLTEFGLFISGAVSSVNTAKFANYSFETTIVSGTDWAFTTGTNFFSGLKVPTGSFSTQGDSSFQIKWFSGVSAIFASGGSAFLSTKFDTTSTYGLYFDYQLFQADKCFQGECWVGGSQLGSMYAGSGTTLAGSKYFDLQGFTGSADLKLMFVGISGPNVPDSGLFHIYFDNVYTTTANTTTTKPWNIVGFPGVNFDGTNELQIQITNRISPSGLW